MKKILIFSIIGLVVLGGGGASAYFLILKDEPAAESALADGETAIATVEEDVRPALYHNLPTLVVNADYQGRLRYLQVKMSVMTREEDTLEKLMDNTPLIQDAMILLLGSYEIAELETAEGKEDLREKAREKIQELVRSNDVESVLFTGFVIQ